MPKIHFLPDDKTVEIKGDEKIRDAALRLGIPLTNVCGGNARCSTCRLLILDGLENCTERTDKERLIADQLAFSSHVRLACQTSVTGDVRVRRLTLDDFDIEITSKLIMGEEAYLAGAEKHVFIMFADIRMFTAFSESLLPYDVIHVLHRYFYLMNKVILQYGGYIDNYMGDGFMALFEVDTPEEGALNSVKAGLEMLEVLKEQVKPYTERLFGSSFEIGIGLHYGLVVAGTIGGSDNKKTTVIGDPVNYASRIESANKKIGTNFLISRSTFNLIADKVETGRTMELEIRGKTGMKTLYEVVGLK
jgi:adenylate cyclase